MLRHRKIIPLLFAVLANALFVSQLAAQSKPTISVSTDRKDALYKIGEDVTFHVDWKPGENSDSKGVITYIIDDEGPNELKSGLLKPGKKAIKIKAIMGQPGFLRCRVRYQVANNKSVTAVATAAISPLKIQPSLPVPDDFDEFWLAQKAALSKVEMKPTLTKVKSPNVAVECFDVKVTCLGKSPVSGYFAKPKKAAAKSLPAILWVHGAGVRSSSLGTAVIGAKEGMLSMDMNAHGIPNGKPAAFYTDLRNGDLKDYRYAGRDDRKKCYFRGMYLRLVRGIDFLTSQPEWDGKTVVVIGHSQGGGQALVAGGIDSRVTMIAAGVPAMCDHTGRAVNRINGWPRLVPNDQSGRPNPVILNVSRYFDAVNFASRCKADAIMSVGFIDPVCPPTTNYAAFNQLKGRKKVVNEPKMRHAAPAHIRKAFLAAVREHIKRQK